MSATGGRTLRSALLYAGAGVAVVILHLATIGTLGFHTDELYYLDCGRHLALGYVDFPPVVPLLARLETTLLGVTPFALRVLPSLAGGLLTVLCGLYVRQLGGSLKLQGLGIRKLSRGTRQLVAGNY
jgi:4-amino-4-deoxy-L-arabinose transferase-like glycosyltransferase